MNTMMQQQPPLSPSQNNHDDPFAALCSSSNTNNALSSSPTNHAMTTDNPFGNTMSGPATTATTNGGNPFDTFHDPQPNAPVSPLVNNYNNDTLAAVMSTLELEQPPMMPPPPPTMAPPPPPPPVAAETICGQWDGQAVVPAPTNSPWAMQTASQATNFSLSLPEEDSRNIVDPLSALALSSTSDLLPTTITPQKQQQPSNMFDPYSGEEKKTPSPTASSDLTLLQQHGASGNSSNPANDDGNADDFWGISSPASPNGVMDLTTANTTNDQEPTKLATGTERLLIRSKLELDDEYELPLGGKKFITKIQTCKKLGVVFYKASQLRHTFFLNATEGAVDALRSRPVIGHVFDNSPAYKGGLTVGTIILRINDEIVNNPRDAIALLKNNKQNVTTLECYDISTCEHLPLFITEGMHMVKYDSSEKGPPKYSVDWKPKYVVVGGILALPYQICMYRSKAEYDTAIQESMKGQKRLSVKIKQFSLVGSKLLYPQNASNNNPIWRVQYSKKHAAWSYLMIEPYKGNPIKIAKFKPESLLKIQMGIAHAMELDKRLEEQEEEYHAELKARHMDIYGGGSSSGSGCDNVDEFALSSTLFSTNNTTLNTNTMNGLQIPSWADMDS